jgi:hypothetical protein
VFASEKEASMTITILTDQDTIDWLWHDDKGRELVLGSWVRTSPLITGEPTGFPDLYAKADQRQLNYGIVYELLPAGRARIQWQAGPEDVMGIEDSADCQLTTKDEADAFLSGLMEGFERGHRAGRKLEIDENRARVGLPELSEKEFDSLVESGVL